MSDDNASEYGSERRREAREMQRHITDLLGDSKVHNERINNIHAKLTEHEQELEKRITKDAFLPVKLLAYGMAGCALTAVLTKILETVLSR